MASRLFFQYVRGETSPLLPGGGAVAILVIIIVVIALNPSPALIGACASLTLAAGTAADSHRRARRSGSR